jgi:hypothetical protein
MKVFIRNIILFSSLLILIISGLQTLINRQIREKSVFRLETTPRYAVIGHSISECAYNDSIIEGLVNLSQSGDSYLYLLYKLKLFLDHNPSIEVVFIEFSNNQIGKSMDERIWGERYLGYKYTKYAPFMTFADKNLIFMKNPHGFLDNSSITFKLNMDRLLYRDLNYSKVLGGYLKLGYNKVDSLLKTNTEKAKTAENPGISEKNLEYLSKIIQFCNEHNIKPILVRSPLHRAHAGFEAENHYQQILRERFSKTEFLDFAHFPLGDEDFADFEHLNYSGAAKFSSFFNDFLKSKK